MSNSLQKIIEAVNAAIEKGEPLKAADILIKNQLPVPPEVCKVIRAHLEDERFPGQDVAVEYDGQHLQIMVFKKGIDQYTKRMVERDSE